MAEHGTHLSEILSADETEYLLACQETGVMFYGPDADTHAWDYIQSRGAMKTCIVAVSDNREVYCNRGDH